MKRTLGGMLVFAIMVLILTGLLQLFNWIPSAIQDGALQRYATIDELRNHLKTVKVYTPAYFPPIVQWPPSLIAAQARPHHAVVMEFASGDDPAGTVLVITQTEIPHPPLVENLRLLSVRESVRYSLKGRPALLEVGICRKNDQCSRLTWSEENTSIVLTMRASPAELSRIAESMISGVRAEPVSQ